MADKIAKLLSRLSQKQLRQLSAVIELILNNDLEGLDIKSLKGHKSVFRVRVGDYRIIFKVQKNQAPNIVLISKRSEKTYKDL